MPNKNDDGYSNNGYPNEDYSNNGNGNQNQNHNHNHNRSNIPKNSMRNSRNNPNLAEMDTFREGFSKNIANKVDDEKTSKIKVHNYTNNYADKYTNDPNNQENLKDFGETFFEEDDNDHIYKEKTSKDDKFFLRNIILMVCIVGLSVAVILLSFSLKASKDELNLANSELTDLLDTQKDAERKLAEEALHSENEALKAELDSLKDPDEDISSNNDTPTTNASTTNSTDTSTVATTQTPTTSASSNTLGDTSYTVQAGDSSIWDISKKLYGNGAYFQKILDANGMKDGDILKEGQVLIIPEL